MIKSTRVLLECDHENRTAKLTFGPFEGGKMFSREWTDANFSLLKDLEEFVHDDGSFGRRLKSDVMTLQLTGRGKPDSKVEWTE